MPASLSSFTYPETSYEDGGFAVAMKLTSLAAPATSLEGGAKVYPSLAGVTVTVPDRPLLLHVPSAPVVAVP